MSVYFLIKTLHIVSATILFGTGLGIAFFMFQSWFTKDLGEKVFALRTTVLADYLFTAPATIIQPLTGAWLIWYDGLPWTDGWLAATYILYLIAGACWLPVVWIQIRLKQIATTCRDTNVPLPSEYHRLFRLWFALGWPAFLGLVAIFFLMVIKPA